MRHNKISGRVIRAVYRAPSTLNIGYIFNVFEILVLLINGWLDRDWMKSPISVKTLSKPCPISVQSREKYKVCPVKYKVCPVTVKTSSKIFEFGQRLDIQIQDLSGFCHLKFVEI